MKMDKIDFIILIVTSIAFIYIIFLSIIFSNNHNDINYFCEEKGYSKYQLVEEDYIKCINIEDELIIYSEEKYNRKYILNLKE